MNAFTRAAAALAGDANLGTPVIFAPVDSLRVTVRGVFSRPVDQFGAALGAGLMLALPAAGLPRIPRKGDTVVLVEAMVLAEEPLRAGLELRVESARAEETMAMFDLVLSVP